MGVEEEGDLGTRMMRTTKAGRRRRRRMASRAPRWSVELGRPQADLFLLLGLCVVLIRGVGSRVDDVGMIMRRQLKQLPLPALSGSQMNGYEFVGSQSLHDLSDSEPIRRLHVVRERCSNVCIRRCVCVCVCVCVYADKWKRGGRKGRKVGGNIGCNVMMLLGSRTMESPLELLYPRPKNQGD